MEQPLPPLKQGDLLTSFVERNSKPIGVQTFQINVKSKCVVYYASSANLTFRAVSSHNGRLVRHVENASARFYKATRNKTAIASDSCF